MLSVYTQSALRANMSRVFGIVAHVSCPASTSRLSAHQIELNVLTFVVSFLRYNPISSVFGGNMARTTFLAANFEVLPNLSLAYTLHCLAGCC